MPTTYTTATDPEQRDRAVTVIGEIDRAAVAEWIDRHYKRDRLTRETGTRARIIDHRVRDLHHHGHTVISHHDCVTGEAAWLTTDPDNLPQARARARRRGRADRDTRQAAGRRVVIV